MKLRLYQIEDTHACLEPTKYMTLTPEKTLKATQKCGQRVRKSAKKMVSFKENGSLALTYLPQHNLMQVDIKSWC